MTVSNRAHVMSAGMSAECASGEYAFNSVVPGDIWIDEYGMYAIKTGAHMAVTGTVGDSNTWYIENEDGTSWNTSSDHVFQCIKNSIGASGGTSVPANVVNNIDMDSVADAIRALETTLSNRTDYSYNVQDELRQIKEIMQLRSEAEHKRKVAVEEFSLFG